MTDDEAAEVRKDRQVRSEQWVRPGSLTIEDGRLVFDYISWHKRSVAGTDSAFTGPGAGMLEAFIRLVDAPDDEVATYASRWGFLDLCRHDLPVGLDLDMRHPWRSLPPYMALTRGRAFALDDDCRVTPPGRAISSLIIPSERYELISTWKWWSGVARSITVVGLRLAKQHTIRPADLAGLYERAPWVSEPGQAPKGAVFAFDDDVLRAMEQARLERLAAVKILNPVLHAGADGPAARELRGTVRDALDFWLDISQMGLRLRWQQRGPDTYFTGALFAALGTQMLMAITGRDGFAFCGGCGLPHVPVRRDPNGKAHSYCASCRAEGIPAKRAAEKVEARRQRERAEAKAARLAAKAAQQSQAATIEDLPTGESGGAS